MSFKTYAWAAAGFLLAITQAEAVTYTYTGNADSTHGDRYISASVDLNCVGPCAAGTYSIGNSGSAGSVAWSLAVHSSTDAVIFSIARGDPGTTLYFFNPNSLTLDSNGYVTAWALGSFHNAVNANQTRIYTTSTGAGLGTDYAYCFVTGPAYCPSASIEYENLANSPGAWTNPFVATPLPAALPLLASGLGGLGLLGWRRKKKSRCTRGLINSPE